MSRQADHLSLIIGNLWQVRSEQITKLRKQYQLPQCKLASLTQTLIDTNITSPLSSKLTNNQRSISSELSKVANSQHNPSTQPSLAKLTLKDTVNIEEAKPTQNYLTTGLESIITNRDSLGITKPLHLNNLPLSSAEIATTKAVKPQELITDWNQLTHQATNCTECKLCYGRTHVVIERGNRQAKWMLIGEGPGEQEDLQGKPFVGASGQLLDKMINAMQLDREQDVYIANVVKCRPPHNRNPEPDEIMACKNYLLSQINLVNPSLIITFGRFAAQTLLNTDIAVGKLRKKVHSYQAQQLKTTTSAPISADNFNQEATRSIPLIVTYYPSYLLRTPAAKKDAWEDLQLAMKTFANVKS